MTDGLDRHATSIAAIIKAEPLVEIAMSAAGVWDIDIPMFKVKGAVLDLQNDGAAAGGRQKLKGGMQIDVRNPIYDAWEDAQVRWKVDFDLAGQRITADFAGTISGNRMQGKVSGLAEFSGVRRS